MCWIVAPALLLLTTACSATTPAHVANTATRPPLAASVSPVSDPATFDLDDLSYTTEFVGMLRDAGLDVQSVQRSVWESFFPTTNKAAWIRTNHGIADVVFFPTSVVTEPLQIILSENEAQGRYVYRVQAQSSEQSIDANRPLYFTQYRNLFIVTDSTELDASLKRILVID